MRGVAIFSASLLLVVGLCPLVPSESDSTAQHSTQPATRPSEVVIQAEKPSIVPLSNWTVEKAVTSAKGDQSLVVTFKSITTRADLDEISVYLESGGPDKKSSWIYVGGIGVYPKGDPQAFNSSIDLAPYFRALDSNASNDAPLRLRLVGKSDKQTAVNHDEALAKIASVDIESKKKTDAPK